MALRRQGPRLLKPQGRTPGPSVKLQCRGASVCQLREVALGRGERGIRSAPGGPQRGLFCIRLNFTTPVTVEMASWAEHGGTAQPGAVPMGRLQGTRCEPPPPIPVPLEEYALYALRLPRHPLEHVQRSPPDVGRLPVVKASCGGLGPDPRKVPLLIATSLVRSRMLPTCRRRARTSPQRSWAACHTVCTWGPSSVGGGGGWSPCYTPPSWPKIKPPQSEGAGRGLAPP